MISFGTKTNYGSTESRNKLGNDTPGPFYFNPPKAKNTPMASITYGHRSNFNSAKEDIPGPG
jgi:hypothetical protein